MEGEDRKEATLFVSFRSAFAASFPGCGCCGACCPLCRSPSRMPMVPPLSCRCLRLAPHCWHMSAMSLSASALCAPQSSQRHCLCSSALMRERCASMYLTPSCSLCPPPLQPATRLLLLLLPPLPRLLLLLAVLSLHVHELPGSVSGQLPDLHALHLLPAVHLHSLPLDLLVELHLTQEAAHLQR